VVFLEKALSGGLTWKAYDNEAVREARRPRSSLQWRNPRLADDARKLGLIIVGAMALTACGRAKGLGVASRDAGTTARDGEPLSDMFANDGLSAKDASADAVTADAGPDALSGREDAGPEVLDHDVAAEVPDLRHASAGPDTTIVEVPDLRHDSASPDTAIVDKDASRDGSLSRKDTATDNMGRDAAADRGGPLACTERFMLGGFLPMGKAAATPSSVALGDLNGDGRLDFVIANLSPATVSVLLGNGDGTFAARTDYAAGTPKLADPTRSRPSMLALGDINGDGKLDIAVAQDGQTSAVNTLVVLLGKGDGTFPTRVTHSADPGPSSVALGDVNGDGKTDVVTANFLWRLPLATG
jgi:hypothetical protein